MRFPLSSHLGCPRTRYGEQPIEKRGPRSRRRLRHKLCLELLEERTVPSVLISGEQYVEPGQPYQLNLFAPADTSITQWQIDWDGSDPGAPEIVAGNLSTVTHTYPFPGGVSITAKAFIDDDGDGAADREEAALVSALGDLLDSPPNLAGPKGITVGPDGDLYAVSRSNEILRFDADTGDFIEVAMRPTPATSNPDDVNFKPDDLAFAPNGLLYAIADSSGPQLWRHDPATGLTDRLSSDWQGGIPRNMVFGPDDNVYVTAEASWVSRFDPATGNVIDHFVEANAGGLLDPHGLVFTPSGDLLVASKGTNEVLRYDGATGAPLGALVTAGSGGLDAPTGLAYGPGGDLFVISSGTNEVLRYDEQSGAFLGTYVNSTAGLDAAYDLIFTGSRMLVTNTAAQTILEFDTNAADVSASGQVLVLGAGLESYGGIELGPDGDLYAVSRQGTALVQLDGQTAEPILHLLRNQEPNGPDNVMIDAPMNVAFSPDGQSAFVSGTNSDNIIRVDQLGTNNPIISEFVASGSDGLDNPMGLTFGPDGHLYVASLANNDVLVFAGPESGTPGAFLGSALFDDPATPGVDESTWLRDPVDVKFDAGGNMYVSSRGTDQLVRYNVDDTVEIFATLSGPRRFTFGPDGHLYVAAEDNDGDALSDVIRVDGQTGAVLQTVLGSVRFAVDVAFGSDGSMFVYDAGDGSAKRRNGLRHYGGPLTQRLDAGGNPISELAVEVLTSTTYQSTDVPKRLQDRRGQENGVTTSTINISEDVTVLDVNFELNVTHSDLSDLYSSVLPPIREREYLFFGGSGANLTGTVFDDEATSSMSAGTAPYTGSFRPAGDLRNFDGLSTAGRWLLVIVDQAKGDSGTLDSWSMTVGHVAPPPTFVIDDVTVSESAATATFTVTRTGGLMQHVTIDYATADSTAKDGIGESEQDYLAANGTLTFAAGVTTQTINITINGDVADEGDETFFVNLSNATNGAVIADGQGVATIIDDDGTPTIDALSDSPDPVKQGGDLTLTASVTGSPDSVSFYRDDGNGSFDSGVDELLGSDSDGSDGWSVTVAIPGNFQTGTYTYFAQGAFGSQVTNVASTTGEVTKKKGGKPNLLAESIGNNLSAESVTIDDVQPLLDEALNRFTIVGEDASALSTINIHITDMQGAILGQAAGNTIWLDSNAAGWGWFVDPTPWDDSEFELGGDQGEQGHMDLLTVIMHEMGHLLGHEHEEDGVMQETLAAGQRYSLEQSMELEAMLFALADSSKDV